MTDEQISELLKAGYGDAADRGRWPAAPSALGSRLVHRVRRRRAVRGAALTGLAALTTGAVLAPGLLSRPPDTPRLTLTAATLSAYADCPAMLKGLVERATPLVGPYGYGASRYGVAVDALGSVEPGAGLPAAGAPREAASAAPSAAAAAVLPAAGLAEGTASTGSGSTAGAGTAAKSGGEASYHSSTTNRTRGVDEPDTVKTDGRLLVSVTGGGWLHTTDPVAAKPLGALKIRAGGPLTVLLVGERAVVLGGGVAAPVAPDSTRPVTGSLTVVDLHDPAAPRVERTVALSAEVVSARLLGATVRLVTRAQPPALRWQQPSPGGDAEGERARTANLALLAAATADDWLPSYSVVAADGRATATGRLYDCTAVEHPQQGDGADTTGVLSFDPASAQGPQGAVAVVGSGDTAYATGTHVWVATTRGLQGGPFPVPLVGSGPASCCGSPPRSGTGDTQLHLFDVTTAAQTRYVASGELPGALLDQTALDEAPDGTLRAVTTDPARASTALTTLQPRPDKTLARMGRLDGLAPGEQVQSVRFVGALAYVVTFRQTDPLTVLDVSQPASPRLRGELRVPGYSALLTEAEPGHLLGVGMAGDAEGRLTGVGVGLFDVGNPDAPTRLDALGLAPPTMTDSHGRSYPVATSSPALADPHAFLYWRPARLAMLPLSVQGRPADLACVRVEPDHLVRVYTLSHRDRPGRGSTSVSRALVVGAHVLTVSDRGVLLSSLASGADQGWAPFAGG